MSYAQIILVGNVGSDPELRYTKGAHAVCNFSLAVNRRRKQGDEWVDETTWFRVTVWGAQAESVNTYVRKGKQVLVASDRIEANAYTANNGEARASLDVTASEVKFLGGKGDNGGGGGRDDEHPF